MNSDRPYIEDENEQDNKDHKSVRILNIYTKLLNGFVVNKAEEAVNYGVNERSIQRDLKDISDFMEQQTGEDGLFNSVVYDRKEKGYRMEHIYKMKFTNSEILAICKILLDSRAFMKKEMTEMLNKLIECCVPEKNRKLVKELIANEEFNYVQPHHGKVFIDIMWEIGQAIHESKYIEIEYHRTIDNEIVKRKLEPAAIMFSEYYFYMAAFIEDKQVKNDFTVQDDIFPTIYRIDRIGRIRVLEEHFKRPYLNRFEEGEFRKRIQFMYGGKLKRVKFIYKGISLEAVLDRLPTAKYEKNHDGTYTVIAEVFGDGIDMWLRSQEKYIEVVK